MSTPLVSDFISPEERVEVESLLERIRNEPTLLREALAELLISRTLVASIRRNRYLMNHREIRPLIDKAPGSRQVPRANLPTGSKR